MEKVLKFGIPKGSLEKATIELFERAGWTIEVHHRSYFPEVDDPELEMVICRPQEMSKYVEAGILDAGITGKDWILDNNSEVVVVEDLPYSKVSKRPARWVIAVRADSEINTLEDLKGKKISTELVNYTKKFFEERGIPVEVTYSWGATEAKVVQGLCDAIVEVTETGTTIKAHGLKIIYEMLITYPQLIANKEAWEDPWKRKKIQQIAVLLKGALNSHKKVGLKMNVPAENLEKVVSILPSITAPTISKLYNTEWYALEVVVSEKEVRNLVPKLLEYGVQGIIEYSLNKII
ncbi:MAG: ATP phosphoribosyltransferase [Caldimicrobium thiodismutans]|jgi:ATP phosphoribosyltransferase|uniref:ATP phosphoribosyltransferase n=1 Tax=Caldimicrobium thiodismutans TaxID=1653476 RepID=A0A2N7PKM9_9BACT|nr:MAG: ATP phosphoribosyltransferase [Caldimicrobium thiodismutans]